MRTACNFSQHLCPSTLYFVPHFRACVSTSPCSPSHSSLVFFFSLNFFKFYLFFSFLRQCRTFRLRGRHSLSFGPSSPRLFGVLIPFRYWSTSRRYVFSVSGWYSWACHPTPCLCCVSVLSSRSCLPTSSSVRTLHPPPSPIRLLIVNRRHSFRLLFIFTASYIS